jgi:hypothetical protein
MIGEEEKEDQSDEKHQLPEVEEEDQGDAKQ